MKTIKVEFRPGCSLFGAMCLIRGINSKVVIIDNTTLMCEIAINDFNRIKKLRNDIDVLNVSFYDNDVETIKGLFDETH